LDQLPLPPTPRTRLLNEALEDAQSSIQALQLDVNAQVAGLTDGATANPKALYTPSQRAPKTYNDANYQAYNIHERAQAALSRTGTSHTSTYSPNSLVTHPPGPSDLTLPLLLANQTHLGHHTSLWNPSNSSYISGTRHGIHIISLDITYACLLRAAKIIQSVAHKGGLILFVGTRRNHEPIVVRAAARAKGYHIFDRWVPGTLTNGQQLLSRCAVKIVDLQDREIPTYSRGLLAKQKHSVIKPDLVVCLNPLENEVCLHECGLNDVPTIGIIDTDANPSWVTYPIPANDDSLRSVGLIAGVLSQAAKEGQRTRLEEGKAGRATYDLAAVKRFLTHTNEVDSLDIDEAAGDAERAAERKKAGERD
jgi:small subunit ribosomal protein S2